MVFGVLAVMLAAGCGRDSGNLGRVSGKVTLDGQPLAGATVVFSPKTAGSSQSLAITDSQGTYSLLQSAQQRGADAGEHWVAIATFSGGDPDSNPPVARVAERVPFKYNLRSELKATVNRGDNTIDFKLATDGPVVQPDSIQSYRR